jgi:hypothetical protein
VNASKAQELLAEAERLGKDEATRLRRGLLVTAAIRDVASHEPVLVGGTAEDFYTPDAYHPTDVDLCGWLTSSEEEVLSSLGFKREGRHWYHAGANIAVEFPESFIDGDEERVRRVDVGVGVAAIIGVDDLYLDRLRQSTADAPDASTAGRTSGYLKSATAVAAANYDQIDWVYVDRQIRKAEREDNGLGKIMRRNHSSILRKLRR